MNQWICEMSGSCFHPRIQFAFYRLFRPLADKYMLAMIHWTLHVMMLQPILQGQRLGLDTETLGQGKDHVLASNTTNTEGEVLTSGQKYSDFVTNMRCHAYRWRNTVLNSGHRLGSPVACYFTQSGSRPWFKHKFGEMEPTGWLTVLTELVCLNTGKKYFAI